MKSRLRMFPPYFYFRFSKNRLFFVSYMYFLVTFAAIFLEMYPKDFREIFSVCRLSTPGSTDKNYTLNFNTFVTRVTKLAKNRH